MHEVSALIAGASVEAARRVWTGQTQRAVNIAGGLHHAMPGCASGFCIYNDPALAIQWMLDHGAERVAYVDVDAHHGDGVQAIFYDDPRVLTVSIHEGPQTLFPGTGYASETGGPGAEGSAVNVALPPGTSDAGWLRAFHAVVPQVLRAFGPEILLSQHGCDSHMDDPLTNLMLSIDGQRASYLALEQLAEELTGGRWIITGGGGYSLTSVVPRIWTHLLAIVAGAPLDPEHRDDRPVAGHGGAADGPPGPAADDRRTQRGLPRLGSGLRPRQLAGPLRPGHPRRGVSAARDGSERLKRPNRAVRYRYLSNFGLCYPSNLRRHYSRPKHARFLSGGEAGERACPRRTRRVKRKQVVDHGIGADLPDRR